MPAVSLTHPPSLTFSELRTPPIHGDVLVVPEPPGWAPAARNNQQSLSSGQTMILGTTLAEWRRRTRMAVVGCDDRLLVVCGHQPAFIHPGVWAKHVLAARFAEAVDGVAINLVVDSDAPPSTSLAVATERAGRPVVRLVRFADLPSGHSYEQIPRQSEAQIAQFEHSVQEAMGSSFASSQMPSFFRGMRSRQVAEDWVAQVVAGRRAIESSFGIHLEERRISECCPGPLLLDMMFNAPRFAACYNAALAAYRSAYGVRGSRRPIPDLHVEGDRFELPVWAWRPGAGRHRFFVTNDGKACRLFAETIPIGEINSALQEPGDALAAALGEWRLRPRALSLTTWARLLLADIFVHGIGGAKYDRISDRIMADYYGVTPPNMACVSATLRLDLPGRSEEPPDLASLRHALRDFQYNPQRHLRNRVGQDEALAARERAISRATALRSRSPRDRAQRRNVFDEIRRLNEVIVESAAQDYEAARTSLHLAQSRFDDVMTARNREYFFGLFHEPALRLLLGALPRMQAFRV